MARMQGRTEFQQQKLQTYEIRQNQYQNTWRVPLMDTILKKPLCKLLLRPCLARCAWN